MIPINEILENIEQGKLSTEDMRELIKDKTNLRVESLHGRKTDVMKYISSRKRKLEVEITGEVKEVLSPEQVKAMVKNRLSYLYEFSDLIDEYIEGLGFGFNEKSIPEPKEPGAKRPGRPTEYDKSNAIKYFDKNRDELYPKWLKTNQKSAVARKIRTEAYRKAGVKDEKIPEPQTIVGYIEDHLSNSEN